MNEKIDAVSPESDEYGNVAYIHEVVDLDLPEGKNVLWKTVHTKQRRLSLQLRSVRKGDVII